MAIPLYGANLLYDFIILFKVYPTDHSTGAMEVGKINRRGNNL